MLTNTIFMKNTYFFSQTKIYWENTIVWHFANIFLSGFIENSAFISTSTSTLWQCSALFEEHDENAASTDSSWGKEESILLAFFQMILDILWYYSKTQQLAFP